MSSTSTPSNILTRGSPRRFVSPRHVAAKEKREKEQKIQARYSLAARYSNQTLQKEAPPPETMIQLESKIARYVRNNDHRMMIRVLKESPHLQNISLSKIEDKFIKHAEFLDMEDTVCKTQVLLNEVLFAKGHQDILEVLKSLCQALTQGHGNNCIMSGQVLYRELLVRLSRTTPANDGYFALNSILGSPDLVVQPPKRAPPLPATIKLYEAHGQIHAIIQTRHPYGLFRKKDMSIGSKRPWVRLEAVVYERVNLTTHASVRMCSVHVQEKV
jgi:hypothetical protein